MKHSRNINVKDHSAFLKEEKGGGVVLNIKNALIGLEVQL